jgi:hypothetical protein
MCIFKAFLVGQTCLHVGHGKPSLEMCRDSTCSRAELEDSMNIASFPLGPCTRGSGPDCPDLESAGSMFVSDPVHFKGVSCGTGFATGLA